MLFRFDAYFFNTGTGTYVANAEIVSIVIFIWIKKTKFFKVHGGRVAEPEQPFLLGARTATPTNRHRLRLLTVKDYKPNLPSFKIVMYRYTQSTVVHKALKAG